MPQTLLFFWRLLAVAQAVSATYRSATVKRSSNKDLLPEYDFIVGPQECVFKLNFVGVVLTEEETVLVIEYGTTFDISAYGNRTPIYMSMPGYQYPGQQYEWKAWSERDGIVVQKEHGNGNAYDMIWIPSSYDPDRAYNRNFEGLVFKSSLVLATVPPSILRPRARLFSASATRTPIILQLSGVGLKQVIEEAGVKSLINLPGVGWNLQDHCHTFSLYNFTKDTWPTPTTIHTNATFRAEALAEYKANTGSFTSSTISGDLLLPARSFTGNHLANLSLELGLQAVHKYYLPDGLDPTPITGYILQHEILLNSFLSDKSAIFEHPFLGSPRGTSILLKPFSRGFVNINPKDPFGDPIFDYRLLSNPIDLVIHLVPGKDRSSNAEVKKCLVEEENLNVSNGHSCGTASMMPRLLGGVVDSDLKVYGINHLSIADTSIITLIVGAHTTSTAYMIGEKAADLIKSRHR
ncbi:hypothetical protein LZ31DRAFT_593443 [Colletotrichum somersetense]|nr:hypothetical protein LZ31DRAFT_593443 [Colletotrichum somersetense]